jgi:hypothetical protein
MAFVAEQEVVACNECGSQAVLKSVHVAFNPHGGPLQSILEIDCPTCGPRSQPQPSEPLESDPRD